MKCDSKNSIWSSEKLILWYFNKGNQLNAVTNSVYMRG